MNKLGYIFLTRDKNYKVGGETTPIVFKVEQEKIRQRYKIFPRVGDIANKNKRIEAEEKRISTIKNKTEARESHNKLKMQVKMSSEVKFVLSMQSLLG